MFRRIVCLSGLALPALVVLACSGSYAADTDAVFFGAGADEAGKNEGAIAEEAAVPPDVFTDASMPFPPDADASADAGADADASADAAPPAPICDSPGKKTQLTANPASVVSVESLASVGGGTITTKGINWTNPGAARVGDDVSASVVLAYPTRGSRKLVLTNFGFAVPAGATIDGIRYEVERRASDLSSVTDLDVRVLVGGAALLSSNLAGAAAWGNFDAVATYGGPTSKFGTAWTPAAVNDVGFGVAFAAWTIGTDASAPIAYVDGVRATVFFTCP